LKNLLQYSDTVRNPATDLQTLVMYRLQNLLIFRTHTVPAETDDSNM